jgi:hypothetical protein
MRSKLILVVIVCVMAITNIALAGIVQGINIDFVAIGNAGNPGDTRTEANPYGCGAVNYNYRFGKYEVTNAQWNAFTSAAGAPTGNPSNAYNNNAYWTGTNMPTNVVSWYEAAQFCNYLTSGDKSKGAYLFSGNNTNPADFLGIDRDWAVSAYGIAYVIPTEDEWYKAAYYTGSGYSTYANGTNIPPVAGVETNYGQSFPYGGPWDVGTGAMEQNGTFDMMGNVYEWNETFIGSDLYIRGGGYHNSIERLESSHRFDYHPEGDNHTVGFRVASVVPEPVMPINLDIKPQSCPNPLNVKSRGLLPVAILGSEDFDVSSIDAVSICLAGVAPIRSSYEDVATPVSDSNECECSTEGPDGFLDLTLKFETQRIVEAIGEVDHGDELVLELTGVLSDETRIGGRDCVLIHGRHKPLNKADFNGDGIVDMADFAAFSENWLQSSIVEY